MLRRFWFLLTCLALPLSSAAGQDWWSISDQDFVIRYGNLATGTQVQQSQFAWMMFGRVNQQVTFRQDQQKYSQWELWPSDLDTFNPNVSAFVAANKVRRVPHLQLPRLSLATRHTIRASPIPSSPSEEVTRNPLSYDYIMSKGLNTRAGIGAYLATPSSKIDFPIGAIETKAEWATGPLPGAHDVGGYSLTALSLMVKIAASPSNPFTDNTPSWFWTTFELKSNKGLAAAQKKFDTYHDVLPKERVEALLAEAGLGQTPFVNYVSNGQQIQFFDAENKMIRLGNTKIEGFLAEPGGDDPAKWTNWPTSCHSCHGQASGRPINMSVESFSFGSPVGALKGSDLPGRDYRSYDFVWSLDSAR